MPYIFKVLRKMFYNFLLKFY